MTAIFDAPFRCDVSPLAKEAPMMLPLYALPLARYAMIRCHYLPFAPFTMQA